MVRKKQNGIDPDVYPTYERTTHNVIEERFGKNNKKLRKVVDGTSLDYYLRNKVINKTQYDHGINLYKLWRVAGIEKSITMKFDLIPHSTSGDHYTDRSIYARKDVYLIAKEMGRTLFSIVENICCYELLATDWAEKEGRPKRSAPDIMRLSLDALGDAFNRLPQIRKQITKKSLIQ